MSGTVERSLTSRLLRLVVQLTTIALLSHSAAAEMSQVPDAITSPLLDLSGSPSVSMFGGSVAPLFHVVEGLSDDVFDYMRIHVVGVVLPEGLIRELKPSPGSDSSIAFEGELQEKELHFMEQARLLYSAIPAGQLSSDVDRPFRAWAADQQAGIALDALANTMIGRYGLERFGEGSGRYLKNPDNWDASLLATALLVGGSVLYFNGVHAGVGVGPVKLGVDLHAGQTFQHALQGDSGSRKLASVELGLKGRPITLIADLGMKAGHFEEERVGLSYRLRY